MNRRSSFCLFDGHNILWQDERIMTYDRMKAKKIKGQHCRFCGDKNVPLVKTRCCNEWICCDTKFVSIRGGGRCQYEHESESLCYFHYNEGHKGADWRECDECRKDLGDKDYEERLKQKWHLPRF